MYQSKVLGQIRGSRRGAVLRAAATAMALVLAGATAASGQDAVKCERTIVKNSAKFEAAKIKALAKCNDGLLKGTTSSCPDAKATDKIDKAMAKFTDKVSGACTGVTLADIGWEGLAKRCVGGSEPGALCPDDDCSPIEAGICIGVCVGGPVPGENCDANTDCGLGGTCDFTSGFCDGGLVNGSACDEAGGADCPGEAGVCTPVNECPSLLDNDLPLDCDAAISTPDDVADCLICAGESAVDQLIGAWVNAVGDASSDGDALKCQRDVFKRSAKYFAAVRKSMQKCRDGVLKGAAGPCPDSKATDKINKAKAKLLEKIAGTCDTAAEISAAIDAAKLYAESSRYQLSDCLANVPNTPAGLADALECMTAKTAGCTDLLAIGDDTCSFPDCGDGEIDAGAGETCDDGNTLSDDGSSSQADVCPADCSIGPCTVGGSATVDVSFASPVDLTGLQILLIYPDQEVSIPGQGNQAPVQARITPVGDFTFTPNDLNYGLRILLTDATFVGIPAGGAFSVNFDTCTGASLSASDFACFVVDASDASLAAVAGVTCTATP